MTANQPGPDRREQHPSSPWVVAVLIAGVAAASWGLSLAEPAHPAGTTIASHSSGAATTGSP